MAAIELKRVLLVPSQIILQVWNLMSCITPFNHLKKIGLWKVCMA